MDRRERIGDPEETHRMIFEGQQAKLWTALPGIIESFDAEAMTCTVQPSVSGTRRKPSGDLAELQMPVLLDCPVCFQGGGGVTLTFPIKQGDECLVVFASRCIDAWWQLGGVQGQAKFRMHNLSDGFVLPGVRSQPRKFSVSTSAAQLRTDDGAAFVEINPETKKIRAQTTGDIEAQAVGGISANAGGGIEATAAGDIVMNAPTITLNAPQIFLNGAVSQGQGSNGGDMLMQGPLHVIEWIKSDEDVFSQDISGLHHRHPENNVLGDPTGEPI